LSFSSQPARSISSSRRVAGLLAAAVVSPLAGAPPKPSEPIPRDPGRLAAALTQTTTDLRVALGAWSDRSTPPTEDVALRALYQQRIYRLLARDASLGRRTLVQLDPALGRRSRNLLAAQRELYRLTPAIAARSVRVGPAAPAAVLLQYYRAGERRFLVPWNLLAAINFVESKFGKLRSASAAGAQGPMQFLPATWRRYGLGGNVHDPHDAVLGAANYLHASGAPRDLRRALHAYNPSPAYVDAVLRYAREMVADRAVFFELYCWQVFVKTPQGDRRVTGPGLPSSRS
jgi:membrane-bound lytic murein transglycosylase B